jgi:hypothetical protein
MKTEDVIKFVTRSTNKETNSSTIKDAYVSY